jgi:hypothetical protein
VYQRFFRLLLIVIPIVFSFVGILYAEDYVPVFTNRDLEKYGAEPEQELEERPARPVFEPVPEGAKPLEKHEISYKNAVSDAGMSPAVANMKLGYYLDSEEIESTIHGMSREELCNKVNNTSKNAIKCHWKIPDPIIEIDFSMGELCRYFIERDRRCYMSEQFKVEIGPVSGKPTIYYVFKKIDNYLVLDKILDGNQRLFVEGATAGGYIRNYGPNLGDFSK